MAILVDKNTKVICQGITGKMGSFHTRLCMKAHTSIVAGVSPGKGGELFDEKIPIYNTVAEAMAIHEAFATMIFVPAPYARDSIEEAAHAQVKLIVCITENIPIHDMIIARQTVLEQGCQLIGPNCPGIITAGACKIGIMPYDIFKPGPIGVISRSGTLTYEAVAQLSGCGLGQSTCIGIGGDPVHGLGFVELLTMFEKDPATKAIVLIGEIGGSDEELAAEWIKKNCTKPVVAFIAGSNAPPGRRMGHAGAIIDGSKGTVASKIRSLQDAGVTICLDPVQIGQTMYSVLKNQKQ